MLRSLVIGMVISVLAIFLVACIDKAFVSGTRSAGYVVESGAGLGKQWKDTRFFAERVHTDKLLEDNIHDPENDAITALHEPGDALGSFPLDRRGGVDWVKALSLGIINPKADIEGKTEMMTMDMDVMFKNTGEMPWVKFPHLAHTQWLSCSNCHPAIFVPQQGANDVYMDAILAGRYCGVCHDKVAFALWVCERCHNTPHEDSAKIWRK